MALVPGFADPQGGHAHPSWFTSHPTAASSSTRDGSSTRRSRPLPPFRFSLQQLVDAVGQLPPVADEEVDNLRVEVFSHELINTAVGAGLVPVVSPGPFMAFQKTGQGWAGEFEFDIFDGESYPSKVGRWSVRAAAIRRTTEVPGHTFERARVLVTPLAES